MNSVTARSIALAAVAITALALVQLARRRPGRRTPQRPIQVKGGEFFFKLSTKSVAKPGHGHVRLQERRPRAARLQDRRQETPLIQPGKTAKLVVSFKKAGKYPYLCTVPGHAAAGMKGVFTVR